MTPLYSVMYNDVDPRSYGGLRVWHSEPQEKATFSTGHGPTIDFMVSVLVLPAMDDYRVTSSVDHFIMDGGELNLDGNPPYTDDQWALAKELATQWRNDNKEKTDAESP